MTESQSPSASPPWEESEKAIDLRRRLVSQIAAEGDVKNPRVLEALLKVPRHLFVPQASLVEAYEDEPFSIGQGQTISQPTTVALMTQALELTGHERVLEIGTGSGYQAAVLSVLAREVYTIELVPELGTRARARLEELGYTNVHVRVGDGYQGWPEEAPFDRIVVTAAPTELPARLAQQLREGGALVAPIGEEYEVQKLCRYRKVGGKLNREVLAAVRFVPMVKAR